MKGLYLINSLEGGGAERVFCKLIELKIKHSVGVFAVVVLDKKDEVYDLPEGVKVFRLDASTSLFYSLIQYFKIVKSFKPDYAVSFLTRANIFNVLASKLFNYKAILSERSNTNGRIKSGNFKLLKMLFVRLLYSFSDAIIAVSEGVKNCLVNDYGIKEEVVYVLNNPVSVPKKTDFSKEDNQRSIVCMGRLVKSKAFDVLLRAYAKSKSTRDLTILGQGPELDSLKAISKSLSIDNRVNFLGYRSNPLEIIGESSFYVMASRLEGFPNSLVEAMSMSRAVIATDCTDGPREILQSNEKIPSGKYLIARNGVLINVDDEPALTKAINLLEENYELRSSLEEKGRQRAQYYTPENFIDKYTGIIKSILAL